MVIQTLNSKLFAGNSITVSALRLDLIHPEVSGNKWFKLKYYLAHAIAAGKKSIVSFGGAYSNHLVALAYACKVNGLSSTAFVRGDEGTVNPSIVQMREYGMELLWATREAYRDKQRLAEQYLLAHPHAYIVPEGGGGELGIRGATEIMQPEMNTYTHIACAIGTGTTLAGIINGCSLSQTAIGISALKIANHHSNDLLRYIRRHTDKNNWQIFFGYHFGGYAKKNEELIHFMNEQYRQEHIPTDIVYTGKLFYAVSDLVHKNFFPPESNVLVVHSGGLQGNRSLPQGLLEF